jgi:hypothetical protein
MQLQVFNIIISFFWIHPFLESGFLGFYDLQEGVSNCKGVYGNFSQQFTDFS